LSELAALGRRSLVSGRSLVLALCLLVPCAFVVVGCAAHSPRASINCAGLYKQTQQSFSLKLEVLNKYSVTTGLAPKVLAALTERSTIIALRHRELCEMYKGSPDFSTELYLRRSKELDEFDLEYSRLVDRLEKAAADKAAARGMAGSERAKASLAAVDSTARALLGEIDSFERAWSTHP
jgi:hypothetical protein